MIYLFASVFSGVKDTVHRSIVECYEL